MTRYATITVLTIILCVAPRAIGATKYAKTNGATSGACDSWANACTLAHALSVASSGDSIWTKSGTYPPFTLSNGVKVIGGFAGTEAQASQSSPASNVTIVDGGSAEQCVFSQDNSATTMLRGFTIRNGNAGGDLDGGGGLVSDGSSALFVQCIFESNKAAQFGAAVAIRGTGSPQFINCTFRNNGVGTAGGAADNDVEPLAGGAVYLHSGTPTFVNCLFYNNKAGEGAVIAVVSGTPTLVNCTLANNYAKIGYGGAVYDQWGKATLRNCILWGNTAVKAGNQFFNARSRVNSVTHTNVQDGYTGTGNVSADPMFADPSRGDFKITCGSPCFGAGIGSNPALPDDVGDLDWDTNTSEPTPKDLAMAARQVLTVDMGAYELPPCPD